MLPAAHNLLVKDMAGPINRLGSESTMTPTQFIYPFRMHVLIGNLKTQQEKNITRHSMIEFIEEKRAVIGTENETLSKLLKDKENQVLEPIAELNHIKKRVRQLTISSACLSEVLSCEQGHIVKNKTSQI